MRSRYLRYLLPGVVFQSVLIGGAYATGREIVEYGAKFGAGGVWAILAIFIGFTVSSALTYEFARRFRLFDYRSFIRALVGPLWPLFDLLFVAMVVIIIAVVSAASAAIAEQILGLPYWLGIAGVTVLVALISASGRATIERFKTIGTVVLYAGYAVFSISILRGSWDTVSQVLSRQDVSFLGPVPIGAIVATGVLYVGYNLATLPSTLFTLDRQRGPGDALWAGLATGVLATVPFIMTYLAILVFYPDESVLGAEVPWLEMLTRAASPGMLVFYSLVVLWTLIETCTGMLHALTDRIDTNLEELDRAHLSRSHIALLTAGVLLAAALLSRLGIIELVARGYTAMAYGFLALFLLPLLTIGVYKILRSSNQQSS